MSKLYSFVVPPLMNSENPLCSLNILHLESDVHQSELIKTELEVRSIPCSITRVWTRDAFSAALTNGQIDVIVADWLPNADASGFDGKTALAEARQRSPEVPFIFFTQQGVMGRDRVEVFRQGASDFIGKLDLPKLVRALHWALYLKQSRKR